MTKILTRKVPSQAERCFATGISMITSKGAYGPNVMAAEWVMQISYDPILIAAFIHDGSQTLQNIEKTKEFGVNVASKEQTSQISIAGGYSGWEIDKMKIKGTFKTVRPKTIKTPLIAGCVINAECRLMRKEKFGDHVMLVGRVMRIVSDDSKSPLIYHRGRYFTLGSMISPDRKEVHVNNDIFEFFKNMANGRFVLKCVGVIVKSKNKILVLRQSHANMIPLCMPPSNVNQRDHLLKFLRDNELNIRIGTKPVMKRFILRNRNNVQRINILLFDGNRGSVKHGLWKSDHDDFMATLI